MEDAFRDHDHLNSGCVTVEHFRSAIARAFDTANLALTEEEFGFLVEKYRRSTPAQIAPSGVVAKRPVPPGVLLVDWRLFCADVDPVVTGLEQDPLAVVKPATVERKLKQLSPEREVRKLPSSLLRSSLHGLCCPPSSPAFRCTAPQDSALTRQPRLPSPARLTGRACRGARGGAPPLRNAARADEALLPRLCTVAVSSRCGSPCTHLLRVAGNLPSLAKPPPLLTHPYCAPRHSCAPGFYFRSRKRSMKATVADHVTRKQFRQALSTAGIELPADQMDLIYEKFDDSNDLSINYVAFTRAVDPTVRRALAGIVERMCEASTLGCRRTHGVITAASPMHYCVCAALLSRCRQSALTPLFWQPRRPSLHLAHAGDLLGPAKRATPALHRWLHQAARHLAFPVHARFLISGGERQLR